MALTPVDILHTQFKTSIRGYSKQQVDEFVRAAREALEGVLAEKTALQRRLEAIEEDVARVRKIESTLSNALTMAQRSADELKANAHQQAEMILREAEQARVRMTVDAQQETEKLRTEAALLESARDRFEAEFRALLGGYSEWLDKRSAAAELRRSGVEMDSVVVTAVEAQVEDTCSEVA